MSHLLTYKDYQSEIGSLANFSRSRASDRLYGMLLLNFDKNKGDYRERFYSRYWFSSINFLCSYLPFRQVHTAHNT